MNEMRFSGFIARFRVNNDLEIYSEYVYVILDDKSEIEDNDRED